MTAGSRQTVHFTGSSSSVGPTGDDRADLDHVGLVEHRVAGHEEAVADDEHRLPVEVESLEQFHDADGPVDLDLASGMAELDDHAPMMADGARAQRYTLVRGRLAPFAPLPDRMAAARCAASLFSSSATDCSSFNCLALGVVSVSNLAPSTSALRSLRIFRGEPAGALAATRWARASLRAVDPAARRVARPSPAGLQRPRAA